MFELGTYKIESVTLIRKRSIFFLHIIPFINKIIYLKNFKLNYRSFNLQEINREIMSIANTKDKTMITIVEVFDSFKFVITVVVSGGKSDSDS